MGGGNVCVRIEVRCCIMKIMSTKKLKLQGFLEKLRLMHQQRLENEKMKVINGHQ